MKLKLDACNGSARVALALALGLAVGVMGLGCREGGHSSARPDGSTSGGHGHEHGHSHAHTPPHGGTPVQLGKGEYHLELVHNPAEGTLRAYVLDGHLEEFIRIPQTKVNLKVKHAGGEAVLSFEAVASAATGETAGNTSLFEARADWLKTASEFDATVEEITINGQRYADVTFSFPKGTMAEH